MFHYLVFILPVCVNQALEELMVRVHHYCDLLADVSDIIEPNDHSPYSIL